MQTLARPTHLQTALTAVQAAAKVVKTEFGNRDITARKGRRDVQLAADLLAQEVIVKHLTATYPEYGIVAEEGDLTEWPGEQYVWAIDPLDGTNNFGYGIAHCAHAVTLFDGEEILLAVIHDPITGRTFRPAHGRPEAPAHPPARLRRATISLVTGYPEPARQWGQRFERWVDGRCKRVLNLWAPALDLALVSTGAIDAMVCKDAALLDVCGGMHLVQASGGAVLAFDGADLEVGRSLHRAPVSFVASRDPRVARELVRQVRGFENESGTVHRTVGDRYDELQQRLSSPVA